MPRSHIAASVLHSRFPHARKEEHGGSVRRFGIELGLGEVDENVDIFANDATLEELELAATSVALVFVQEVRREALVETCP